MALEGETAVCLAVIAISAKHKQKVNLASANNMVQRIDMTLVVA